MYLKICGFKDPENIKQIATLKPDFMGFIFYPGSKRYVGEDFLMPYISPEIKKVGVFVNATATYIVDKIDQYKLDLIQLHGDETPEFCEVLNHIIPVVKSFGVDVSFDLSELDAYKNSCSYFLFDTKSEGYGGTGVSFDLNLLKKYNHSLPFFISGGIGLEESKGLNQLTTHPFGVDVNSKFEFSPGIKDINKLKELQNELSS